MLGMTVKQLKDTLTSREYEQWIAFYEVEPFGFDMQNARAGMVAATMANIWKNEKNKKTYSWYDFFPQSKPRKSWKDLINIFKKHGNG